MFHASSISLATGVRQQIVVLVLAVFSLLVVSAHKWPTPLDFGFKLRAFSNFVPFAMQTTLQPFKPPQPPPKWNHAADEIIKRTQEAIDQDRETMDAISVVPVNECNHTTVFLPLANAEAAFDLVTTPLSGYRFFSPSVEVRDASSKAVGMLLEYEVESSMRLDLFQAKLAAEKNLKSSGEWNRLDSESQRLVEKMILDGKRAGLALPEKERDELKALKKELESLRLQFTDNYNQENGTISFTLAELEGVPEDVISGYAKRKEGEKEIYDVTFKEPDIVPIFKYAVHSETRRRAWEANDSRLEVNVPIVPKIFGLRRKITKIMGYDTWADYITEVKMAKSARNALDFLDDLEQRLRPLGLKERETLLSLKHQECKERGLPFDGEFYIWDYRYYDRMHHEKTLDVDYNLVKEYFPVTVVVPIILDIYQHLLGVRFEEIKEGAWHPDVQEFAVWEKDATDESGFLGYCYLDIFPRESKYPHAAVFPLLTSYVLPNGRRNYPVAAMVANLAKPTPAMPALMMREDVTVFFHEMGHAFHWLLSKTRYSRFHGFNVAEDFTEAPSQMLEYWTWEPKVLAKTSSHYQTKEALPADLIAKIVKSRYINIGLSFLRQIFFAKFDLKVHTDQDEQDYTKLWNELLQSISLMKVTNLTPGQADFNHIMDGYDAGYYGYTYSLVFAADMYATVFKKDPLDPALGRLYRDKVLLPGGSKEELELLKDFLGRPPNSDAFMKELFGSTPASNLTRQT